MTEQAVNVRAVALELLLEITGEHAYSHVALRGALERYQYLEKQDRAFLTRLTEGTMERLLELDYIIGQYSTVPVKKQKPVIRNLLRMSVYQLFYMDRIPDAAVCNEAVKLAQKKGFGNLKGFVNGVLRKIAREKDRIAYPDWSVQYSTPEWIVRQWREEYGEETALRMLESQYETRPLTVRVNLAKISRAGLRDRLESEGVCVQEIEELDCALAISGYDYLRALPSFREGLFQVQDVSSMKAALLAAPRPGDYCIDVCAAPGGKSLHLADLLAGTGMVEARDLTDQKTDLIRENMERAGVRNMKVVRMDAVVPDEASYEKADIVLADLPCSGLGVLGKKRDLKYRMTPEQQKELAELQRKILGTVWRYVRPGGTLIYSTCTVHREENEGNTRWFLDHYPFLLKEQVQMLPGEGPWDGFYIAKWRECQMVDIKSLTLQELQEEMERLGEKRYRAKQIYSWMHEKLADSFDDMTDLSGALRERLKTEYELVSLPAVQVQTSGQDGTSKFLFRLSDGNMIESVLMRYHHGNSVCISSQAGCRMGCRFCASTLGGLKRGLTPSEMLDQIYQIQRWSGERVHNVVVMGTGEPLDNYDALLRFLKLLTGEGGLHISQRNVTVSTCGIVPKIRQLAKEHLQITLALSLHASSQEKREELMPVAKKYGLQEVLEACRYYFEETGRRITFEYSLVSGVNDRKRTRGRLRRS